jgi:hypothetical protein
MAGAEDPLVSVVNAHMMQWLIPDARLAIDHGLWPSLSRDAAGPIRGRRRIPFKPWEAKRIPSTNLQQTRDLTITFFIGVSFCEALL